MKDNTVTTADGIEVYKHNIKYYADEYIINELDIDHVDQDNKQIVKDNFVDMLFYISDHITKPDNADIKALGQWVTQDHTVRNLSIMHQIQTFIALWQGSTVLYHQ